MERLIQLNITIFVRTALAGSKKANFIEWVHKAKADYWESALFMNHLDSEPPTVWQGRTSRYQNQDRCAPRIKKLDPFLPWLLVLTSW